MILPSVRACPLIGPILAASAAPGESVGVPGIAAPAAGAPPPSERVVSAEPASPPGLHGSRP